jgi:hypothetical protein
MDTTIRHDSRTSSPMSPPDERDRRCRWPQVQCALVSPILSTFLPACPYDAARPRQFAIADIEPFLVCPLVFEPRTCGFVAVGGGFGAQGVRPRGPSRSRGPPVGGHENLARAGQRAAHSRPQRPGSGGVRRAQDVAHPLMPSGSSVRADRLVEPPRRANPASAGSLAAAARRA